MSSEHVSDGPPGTPPRDPNATQVDVDAEDTQDPTALHARVLQAKLDKMLADEVTSW